MLVSTNTPTNPPTNPPINPPTNPPINPPTNPPIYKLPAGISNGDNVAAASTPKHYIENNTRRAYTNAEIYQSYGSPTYKTIDFSILMSIPAGPNMVYKTSAGIPSGFGNGDIVSSGSVIFKIDAGKLRKFPSTAVYATWGSPVAKPISDSARMLIPLGNDMAYNIVNGLPGNVTNGQNVRNASNMGIYLIFDGKSRWYSSPLIYQSYGSPSFIDIPQEIFSLIPVGESMPSNTPVIPTPSSVWQTVANYGETMNLIRNVNVRYGTTGNGVLRPAGDMRCIAANFGLQNETPNLCQVISTEAANVIKYPSTGPNHPNQVTANNTVFIPIDFNITNSAGNTLYRDWNVNNDRFMMEKNRWRRFTNCTGNPVCFNLTHSPAITQRDIPTSQRVQILEGQTYTR